jgi:hypothetical protein
MYVLADGKTIVEYPYSLEKMKKDNPASSFPRNLTEEILNANNVYSVVLSDPPEYDQSISRPELSNTPIFSDGVWTLGWDIVQRSDEEIADELANKKRNIRLERDALLVKTDWSQLSDSPLTDGQKQTYAVYRQSLRDITDQATFPDSVEWPAFDN